MSKKIKQIKGISEVLQISMCNNMPLSVNEKRKIFDFIIDLQQKVEQLENIRKEAIECIETDSIEINTKEYGNLTVINSDDLLNILNKGSDK